MEYSPNLCFAGFECKRSKSSNKRREKLAKAELSRHNFIMSQHNFKITSKAMSQQEMIYRNKEEVELKLEVKIVTTFYNFITT